MTYVCVVQRSSSEVSEIHCILPQSLKPSVMNHRTLVWWCLYCLLSTIWALAYIHKSWVHFLFLLKCLQLLLLALSCASSAFTLDIFAFSRFCLMTYLFYWYRSTTIFPFIIAFVVSISLVFWSQAFRYSEVLFVVHSKMSWTKWGCWGFCVFRFSIPAKICFNMIW